MAGKSPPSDNTNPSGVPSEPPPPYTPIDPNSQSCPPYYATNSAAAAAVPPRTVVVNSPDMVFSKLARFNDGISKPVIPPPPPGCMPNQYQLMQMQGPVQVVLGQPNDQQQNAQQHNAQQHNPQQNPSGK